MEEDKPHQQQSRNPRVLAEWEVGLPSVGDLIPISQSLISPELASAFGISPPAYPTGPHPLSPLPLPLTSAPIPPVDQEEEEEDIDDDEEEPFETLSLFPSGHPHIPPPPRRADPNPSPIDCGGNGNGYGFDDDNSSACDAGDDNGSSSGASRGSSGAKKPRLVWTPQLHKRFVDVIEHLGVEKAVPKTIMEMMNVEGLTRENVASHLQKYRLYLKRTERMASTPGPAGDLSSLSNPNPNPNQRSGSSHSLSDPYGGNGVVGYGQISQPSAAGGGGLPSNSMNMMMVPIPPPPLCDVVGMRRYGYSGGGGGTQLGLAVGVGAAPPQAGHCGLESRGFSSSGS